MLEAEPISPLELAQILSFGKAANCREFLGSASFTDIVEWDRLASQFDQWVASLNAALGYPGEVAIGFTGEDVERLMCWRQSDRFAYVLLSYVDNTRVHQLIVGICRSAMIRSSPADWWSLPPM